MQHTVEYRVEDLSGNKKRKRGRQARSCAACHKRKQRCDGALPCFNCARRNVATSCEYNEEADAYRRRITSPRRTSVASEQRPEASDQRPAFVTGGLSTEQSTSTGRNSPEPPDTQVGNLFRSRDAPSFFGSSYFGPQAAAKAIEAPAPHLPSGISHTASSAHSFRDVGGPFSQIWDLLGLLPRNKKSVDRLVAVFMSELNWTIDAVHSASFIAQYDLFWERKFGFDDFATIDLRWLALLFIVLAYGVYLDCPKPQNNDVQRELQETSLRFYWAARRAIVIAPTFYGESTDLVRAGVLVTRYLIHVRRVPEAWLTTSFAMRMAQAQGMHIDGERWRLPRKETETRRRLWSHLYMLDKTIALAIGRPFAIVDQQCLVKRATNVWLDDKTEEDAVAAPEHPLSEPTLSLCSSLAHDLAKIVGDIQEKCFGLLSVSSGYLHGSVACVSILESTTLAFDVPFRSSNVTSTLLAAEEYHKSFQGKPRRVYIIGLRRSCHANRLLSATTPRSTQVDFGAHHLFNSALVLGIIAMKDPHSPRSHAILEDLTAYSEMQRADVWLNEFALAEVKIIELCVKKANQFRADRAADGTRSHQAEGSSTERAPPETAVDQSFITTNNSFTSPNTDFSGDTVPGLPNLAAGGGPFQWQAPWSDPSFSLFEPIDLRQWENVLDTITQDQVLFGL
ncbi:hypothetical protein OPT61_g1849 [Boeremia exigua]|uniref:Uncharacterized protein n=1 Tax=Boeremia exigua TaxID=749465 RepID=A0ACC2INM4_9PLEO|nr:hypothetical protein OPT61_g1849 [Boeremia exigua]